MLDERLKDDDNKFPLANKLLVSPTLTLNADNQLPDKSATFIWATTRENNKRHFRRKHCARLTGCLCERHFGRARHCSQSGSDDNNNDSYLLFFLPFRMASSELRRRNLYNDAGHLTRLFSFL